LLLATAALGAGLISMELGQQRRRQRLQRALATDPQWREELAGMRALEASTSVVLLVVHVEEMELSSKFARKKMQVCVKFGEAGSSQQQFSRHVRSTSEGMVQYGSTCVFPWRANCDPVLRIRVHKCGVLNQVVSKEELWLPFDATTAVSQLTSRGMLEHEVLLFEPGPRRELLGRLLLGLQLHTVPLAELRAIGMVPCQLSDLVIATHRPLGCRGGAYGGYEGGYDGYVGAAAAAPAPQSGRRVVAGHIVTLGQGEVAPVRGTIGGPGQGDVVVGPSVPADDSSEKVL